MNAWGLFRIIMSRGWIATILGLLFVVFGALIGLAVLINGPGHKSFQSLSVGLLIVYGMGYMILFHSYTEKVKRFISYEYNFVIPHLRQDILKVTFIYFILLFFIPLTPVFFFDNFDFTLILGLCVFCWLIMASGISNSAIVVLFAFIAGGYLALEIGQASKGEAYSVFSQALVPANTLGIISLATCIYYFCHQILTGRPSQFTDTKRENTFEKSTVDPYLVRGKLTLLFRRFDLKLKFESRKLLNISLAKPSIAFWNYRFHSLMGFRLLLLGIAISAIYHDKPFYDLLITAFIDDNATIANSSVFAPTVAIILIAAFGSFDSGTIAELNQSIKFLWLKMPEQGQKNFLNSVYKTATSRIVFEFILSYLGFLFVMSTITIVELNVLFFSIAFFMFKFGNFLLYQNTIDLRRKRWVVSIIAVLNVVMVVVIIALHQLSLIIQLTTLATCMIAIGFFSIKKFYDDYQKLNWT